MGQDKNYIQEQWNRWKGDMVWCLRKLFFTFFFLSDSLSSFNCVGVIFFFCFFSMSVSNYLRLYGQENFRSQRGQVPPTPAAPLWLCPCVYEFKWLIITYAWIYNFLFTNHAVTSKNCKKFCGPKLFFQ